MTTRDRPAERARAEAAARLRRAGDDLRTARRSAGLSLREVASRGGTSHTQVRRVERGLAPGVTVIQLASLAALVGLELPIRLYPAGDPIRDAGQSALLDRFHRRLHPSLGWRTEVPLPIDGDRRAWDAVVSLAGQRCVVEAETRLDDLQALERRVNVKLRDGRADIAVLLVARTRVNRAALLAHPAALRSTFPGSTREAMLAVTSGHLPPRSAVVVL